MLLWHCHLPDTQGETKSFSLSSHVHSINCWQSSRQTELPLFLNNRQQPVRSSLCLYACPLQPSFQRKPKDPCERWINSHHPSSQNPLDSSSPTSDRNPNPFNIVKKTKTSPSVSKCYEILSSDQYVVTALTSSRFCGDLHKGKTVNIPEWIGIRRGSWGPTPGWRAIGKRGLIGIIFLWGM